MSDIIQEFKEKYFLLGHMNPAGYLLVAKMVDSYIDYIIRHNLDDFKCIAEDIIKQNGFSYTVKARVGKSYFDTREYDDFALPAGEYDSLIITIGEGNGKNWWCVIFPEICLPACGEAKLTDTVSESSAKIAENKPRYKVRFKIVEIYEDIKNFLS